MRRQRQLEGHGYERGNVTPVNIILSDESLAVESRRDTETNQEMLSGGEERTVRGSLACGVLLTSTNTREFEFLTEFHGPCCRPTHRLPVLHHPGTG